MIWGKSTTFAIEKQQRSKNLYSILVKNRKFNNKRKISL